jgi:hypothetical protein
MAATFTNIQANFRQRFGPWIDPLPEENTIADAGTFVSREMRSGLNYNFPVLAGVEHGQTPNVDNSAFTIGAAVDSQVLLATLDGATILMQAVVSYDAIYKGLNGSGNSADAGAYKDTLQLTVEAMLKGAELYRELALMYGPGTGSVASSNIGVVGASISGANLAAPQVVTLTTASWIPGLWILMQNALVDVYQSDGTTLRDNAVTVQGRPSTTLTRLQLFKTASAATVAVNDIIVPRDWRTKSCYGLEAIYNNATTLFGINAALVAPWRCLLFSAGGQLTRAKILGYGAQVSVNGLRTGGKLFVCAGTFADLSEEAAALRRFTDNSEVRTQGASKLIYTTACGDVEVVVYGYAKQGQAPFVANDNFRRVGSTDITMRPLGGLAQGFLQHSQTTAGMSMRVFSNQAPVFEKPFINFLVTGIVNSANSGVAVQG